MKRKRSNRDSASRAEPEVRIHLPPVASLAKSIVETTCRVPSANSFEKPPVAARGGPTDAKRVRLDETLAEPSCHCRLILFSDVADVRQHHGATRPPGYDARYSVILVPIFVRRCSPLPYVPSPVFLLFAAFNRSALRCSSDSGDGLSGLRQAVNSEILNISDCGKRPAGLHSLTRCWWATRLSIVCRC
jgi:hypothetical protein